MSQATACSDGAARKASEARRPEAQEAGPEALAMCKAGQGQSRQG